MDRQRPGALPVGQTINTNYTWCKTKTRPSRAADRAATRARRDFNPVFLARNGAFQGLASDSSDFFSPRVFPPGRDVPAGVLHNQARRRRLRRPGRRRLFRRRLGRFRRRGPAPGFLRRPDHRRALGSALLGLVLVVRRGQAFHLGDKLLGHLVGIVFVGQGGLLIAVDRLESPEKRRDRLDVAPGDRLGRNPQRPGQPVELKALRLSRTSLTISRTRSVVSRSSRAISS
jgi:hypothetical protein